MEHFVGKFNNHFLLRWLQVCIWTRTCIHLLVQTRSTLTVLLGSTGREFWPAYIRTRQTLSATCVTFTLELTRRTRVTSTGILQKKHIIEQMIKAKAERSIFQSSPVACVDSNPCTPITVYAATFFTIMPYFGVYFLSNLGQILKTESAVSLLPGSTIYTFASLVRF